MTITPTPVTPPASRTASAAAGAGSDKAPAGFAALLAQLAAAALPSGKTGAHPGTAPAAPGEAGTEGGLPDGSEAGTAEQQAAIDGVAEAAAAVLAAPKTEVAPAVVQPAPSAGTAAGSLAETAVRGIATTALVDAKAASADTGQAPAGRLADGQLPAGLPAADGEDPGATQSKTTLADAQVTLRATAAAAESQPGAQPQPGAQTGGATPPAAPTASAAGAGTAAAPAAAPNPVLDQVTPVLSRMVSAAEGSHRMVLRLHPADLGEVHLTVTVRGDSVDVRVAAGSEARELLAGGSHELRALLDSIGRTAGQITFRDLPSGPQLPPAPTASTLAAQADAGQQGTTYGEAGEGGEPGQEGQPGAESSTGGAGRKAGEQHGLRADPGQPSTTGIRTTDGALDVRI